MPDLWEAANNLDRDDPLDAALDADRDGLANGGEYLAGTNPNDAGSVFTLRAPATDGADFAFRCATVTGRVYRVQARGLAAAVPWSETSTTNGTGGEIEFRQPALAADGRLFRVKLELAPLSP
jgi:hypothetical protein